MSLRETVTGTFVDDAEDTTTIEVSAMCALAVEPVAFTALERQVIALATQDTLASLEAPGRIERLVSLLFGLKVRGRALADQRLEALRRAVVVTRHRHHMPDAVAAELRGVGFGPRQLRAIEALAHA